LDIRDDRPGWPDEFGKALREWVRRQLDAPIKILSLFSGCGGLDIAFHDAGFDVIQMVEVDSRFTQTLEVNSSKGRKLHRAKVVCTDIRDFKPPENFNVDFIIGGPPCQTFSAAGRRAAGVSGLDDSRGILFREYARLLEQLRPTGFLFENVYGIIGAQNGRPWQAIVKAFRSIGYVISYRILDTADYGVPQHRERLIIVGTQDKEFLFPRPTHGLDSLDKRPYYTAGLAITGVDDHKPKVVGGRYGHLLTDIPPGLNYSFYTEEMGHPKPFFAWRSKFSDFLYKADPEMPVRTIKASGGLYTGPFHWENRPLSIGELKRLQTFPDDYTIMGGQQVITEQIGNSVPPQFGRILALGVLNQVFGVNLSVEIDYLLSDETLGFRKRKRLLNPIYQKKAQDAIAQLYSNVDSTPQKQAQSENDIRSKEGNDRRRVFTAYLDPDVFLWSVKGECEREYPWNIEFVRVETNEQVDFFVGKVGNDFRESAMTIEIVPLHEWKLPVKAVHLHIYSLNRLLFTAAWKAFEHYVKSEGFKADLVQLNGYYQYEPQLVSKILWWDSAAFETASLYKWKAIRYVIEGKGVRQIISLENLAQLWELPLEETIDALVELRSISYEVRSEYTNSQIPAGHVLIPYSFPTLNPKSVQLRKVLFPASVRRQ
jgi:DNA (cytosine-5)-methyltransferase 1